MNHPALWPQDDHAVLRVVHLSDLHLRRHLPGTSILPRRLSRHVPALLKQVVHEIRSVQPDLLVLSGDLLDYPLYAMHDPAFHTLALHDLRLIADMLAPLRCPLAVVAGNHDHPLLVRQVFGHAPDDFTVGNYRVLLFHDEEVYNHAPQRLEQQRVRFLAAVRDGASLPQIHVQHYLVWPERNEGYPHTYLEAQHLHDNILACGRVRLVLSGHYHRGVHPFREDRTWFSTVPAFAEPPHPYRLYTLSQGAVEWEEHVLFDPQRARRPAVFLDRDGTVTQAPAYYSGPEGLRLLPGAAQALKRLACAGYALVLVTNQTCVAQGYVTVETVGAVNDRLASLLAEQGAALDGVYCAYHTPDAVVPIYRCDSPECKPSPALLQRAAEDLHLDLGRSWIIGDRRSDLEAGRNAGTRTILVRTGAGADQEAHLPPALANAVYDDLVQAAERIVSCG